MNKLKNWQQQHTKEKLEIFKHYLIDYLIVLAANPKLDRYRISIIDCFAGDGINKQGIKGSPVIAAEAIKEKLTELENQGRRKTINLFANEINEEKFDSLKQSLKDYESFTKCSNQDADIFLKDWIQKRPREGVGTYTFLFIDPYGYTDITDFKSLFTQARCDYLMFLPIFHIYRFLLGKEEQPPAKPVMEFLKKLEINESIAQNCNTPDEFAEHIRNALIRISGKEFCYCHILKGISGKHGLFFLSEHHLGAEKFLETLKKLRESKKKQISFNFLEKPEKDVSIIEKILKAKEGKIPNTDLYIECLKEGLLSPQMKEALKILHNKEKKIAVFDMEEKRKTGKVNNFYVRRQYYEEGEKGIKIYVQYIGGLNL